LVDVVGDSEITDIGGREGAHGNGTVGDETRADERLCVDKGTGDVGDTK
jgi:hypothetical protein